MIRNHVLNLAVKDFLTALGELDEDDVAEFERNFKFDDLTAAEIEEQFDLEVLKSMSYEQAREIAEGSQNLDGDFQNEETEGPIF